MIMHSHVSLIEELEIAIKGGSNEKRTAILRQVTDFFVTSADRLNDQQVGVFDDVLGHLVREIESKALAELSLRLAAVNNAPKEVMRRMAHHDEIAVAGPVLTQSECLTTDDLVEIAKSKGQGHLLAISKRTNLGTFVTDALLQRGDREVDQSLASNGDARFSETGLSTLVSRAEKDEDLAAKVCSRRDIPSSLVRQLVLGATETVRDRLRAAADPSHRAEIERVLGFVSDQVGRVVTGHNQYVEAQHLVLLMKRKGVLDEAALVEFARTQRYEEMIAALSALCSVPIALIERLLQSDRSEIFLVPCKAAGFGWSTVNAILNARSDRQMMAESDIARAKTDYQKLSKATAERVLRFWQVRDVAQRAHRPFDGSPAHSSTGT
jgi:uncharacterized protein (DUF2336 family)